MLKYTEVETNKTIKMSITKKLVRQFWVTKLMFYEERDFTSCDFSTL